MEQYCNTEQCIIQHVNRIVKVKVPFSFLLSGHQTLFSKICELMKQLLHVPNIILSAIDDDGDDADDNDGDANYDYGQGYEC